MKQPIWAKEFSVLEEAWQSYFQAKRVAGRGTGDMLR